jgi:hypothetical protein
MAELPYVINTGKLGSYLETIQTVGVPDKASTSWLASVGYKSSNDRYAASFLKDLGFADSSGTPTEVWLNYRHKNEGPKVLAAAIRSAYEGLFKTYPNADEKDSEAVRNWMRTHAPKASPTTIDRAVNTFRELCKHADFSGDPAISHDSAPSEQAASGVQTPALSAVVSKGAPPGGVVINLNVELQLPSSASAEDYENFFAAMRKHLIDGPASDS